MTAAAVQAGWLDEMTDLYGVPRTSKPIRTGRTTTSSWMWPHIGSVTQRVTADATGRIVETSLRAVGRDSTVTVVRSGLVAGEQVLHVLRAAGLLPCQVCRGLKEVPADQVAAGELWSRCECTDPSPRPRTGVAVTG